MKSSRRTPSTSVSRRDFLVRSTRYGTVAALSASAATGAFLKSSTPVSAQSSATSIVEMSMTEMSRMIRSGHISSKEAVEVIAFDQIAKVNDKINAVVQTCRERAVMEAKAADAARSRGQSLGPLHGIPFTIKDSLETQGVISTAGTLGLKDYVPEQDATVVARLRKAGAILIGKTNTPEFTLGGATRGTWNLVYGQTNNPYNLAHTPRGSSGGAGAIVAACGAPFDIGSDFGGSIRSPAHACGIVGIKPTFGRVPRTGHWPGYGGMFDSYQQLGPLCRSVGDVWEILKIIAGPDGRDAAIIPAPLGDPASVRLPQLKVAFYTDNGVMTPTQETIAMVKSAARAMEAIGAQVTESYHGGFAESGAIRTKLMTADGGASFQRLLDKAGTSEPSSGIKRYLTGEMLQTPEITLLLEQQDSIRSKLAGWFRQYDVILCPTNAYPAPAHAKPVPNKAGYTSLYNVTGWPATVVRGGTSAEGLPLGLQIVARPWREDVTIAVAAYMESILGGWVKPAMA
ncbi:MAG: amidase [Verrucomicrobia bacterium]|nr:amidase [Verrucomicrobiota bacterium]